MEAILPDTYLKTKNLAAFDELSASVINMRIPVQGSAAQPEQSFTSEGGETIKLEAVPAKGDPAYWYTFIRAPFPIPAFGEIELCDKKEGIDVCGV